MIQCEYFGKTKNGETVLSFCIKNKSGEYVRLLNYGGIIQSLCVRDKNGDLKDVVLGFNSVEEYEGDPEYVGALVGRVANRIKDAKFTLGGKEYQLAPMEFGNTIHGGVVGYSFRVWENSIENDALVLTLHSPDGDEGFPGNLDVKVIYSFTDDAKLRIDYEAIGDSDTIVNLTNHVYFNLDGEGSIENQSLFIDADAFTEMDERFLTTGKILAVDGTPFDFKTPKAIGKDIDADYEQLKNGMGYDHNFVLNQGKDCVIACSEKTGIEMHLDTSFPGLQFYSGNSLPVRKGKYGETTPVRAGFCLETQFYPGSPSHPHFPSIVLKGGELWKHYAEFSFSLK